MSYFITVLFPLIAIGVLVFMIKTANPTTDQKEPLSGVIKIFMNYAQIFSLASAFEINWPGDVRQLFRTAKDFSSPRVSFYSSDCTIGWNYYNKLFLYLTLPVIFITVSWGVLRVVACRYGKWRTNIIAHREFIDMGFETKQAFTKKLHQIVNGRSYQSTKKGKLFTYHLQVCKKYLKRAMSLLYLRHWALLKLQREL